MTIERRHILIKKIKRKERKEKTKEAALENVRAREGVTI